MSTSPTISGSSDRRCSRSCFSFSLSDSLLGENAELTLDFQLANTDTVALQAQPKCCSLSAPGVYTMLMLKGQSAATVFKYKLNTTVQEAKNQSHNLFDSNAPILDLLLSSDCCGHCLEM